MTTTRNQGDDIRHEEEEWLKPPASSLGLHQVYPNPNTRSNPDIDVVFVHGLGGDSISTWTKDKSLWIRALLPKSPLYQNARILSYGYDARAFVRPFAHSVNGRVFTFAEALLGDLRDKRVTAAARARPLILMGHSLGGIVIKSALLQASAREALYGDLLRATKAIVFFGTPHQGAGTAEWASFLGGLGQAVGLRSTEVVGELKRWSHTLVEQTTLFADLWERFDITTFYETMKTNGVMIVPDGAARVGQRNEQARRLVADHIQVCKFSENDANWTTVRGRLDAIVEGIMEAEAIQMHVVLPDAPLQEPARAQLRGSEADEWEARVTKLKQTNESRGSQSGNGRSG
ncbi:alpha/beta hydrolase family protein [Hirsutella rhossiliensis]|uniref:Alpha/beta hydrolase family domain-containing protein n=1 Tax=Hirsutella rhossiliensis TaxID=111463 RepID=A0A9P8MV68_9HYPO|nr:alpha/beta hydrolase family domain-containing protein [Hirsutella rhossiliensis]KAH0961749.1 alpha/beta hydrolase family domain-containing protein [Hirsutella rhossiliensis]